MPLAEELRARHAQDWERVVRHPFVLALGDGSLPREVFGAYMAQDYLFVDGLIRLVASGIAKAPSVASAKPLGTFLQTLLGAEDELFHHVFAELGSPWPLPVATEPLAVTRRFNALLATTARKEFVPIATALYVTEGTYADWAARLTAEGRMPEDPLYREWIDIHADPALADLVVHLGGCMESSTADGPAIERVFSRVLRLEAMFWDALYPAKAAGARR